VTTPISWRDRPFHTVPQTANIIGGSTSRAYALLKDGTLEAVRLAGKTLIKTESIIIFLATAQPWKPNHERVMRAVRARSDVIAKAAARAAAVRQAAKKTPGRHSRASTADRQRRQAKIQKYLTAPGGIPSNDERREPPWI
jgi:hypothetical protein